MPLFVFDREVIPYELNEPLSLSLGGDSLIPQIFEAVVVGPYHEPLAQEVGTPPLNGSDECMHLLLVGGEVEITTMEGMAEVSNGVAILY